MLIIEPILLQMKFIMPCVRYNRLRVIFQLTLNCKQLQQTPNFSCSSLSSNQNIDKTESSANGEVKEWKWSRIRDCVYINTSECAIRVSKYLLQRQAHIFEVDPGPGILTETLLKNDVKRLTVFEPQTKYAAFLHELQSVFSSERLQINSLSFFNIANLVYGKPTYLIQFSNKLLTSVAPVRWEDDPPVIVFGALPPSKENAFVRSLPKLLIEKLSLFALGRTELILFMSHKLYSSLTAVPPDGQKEYRSSSILYNLFFDVELLDKVSRNDFIHTYRGNPIIKLRVKEKYDVDHLYLVRITPKKQTTFKLPENVDLHELYTFIKKIYIKKSDFIITKLESFIPNCGHKLIEKGYTTTTRFRDLKPCDVAALFVEFSSWPEYHTTFKSANSVLEVDEPSLME